MNKPSGPGRNGIESLPGLNLEPVNKPKHRRKRIFRINKKSQGETVREARLAAGWDKLGDQGVCDKLLGFAQGTISGIETGKSGMSNETMVKISVRFCVRPDKLFGLPNATLPEGWPSNGKGIPWQDAIALRVAFSMKCRNLSPRQLAALSGLSEGTITEIARGESYGTPESLACLCLALNVPLWWVLGFPSFA